MKVVYKNFGGTGSIFLGRQRRATCSCKRLLLSLEAGRKIGSRKIGLYISYICLASFFFSLSAASPPPCKWVRTD
ncbi:hypothetical protein SDJN02_08900, partial [Cucurbita argyrosperma subsp. argyrosperma]